MLTAKRVERTKRPGRYRDGTVKGLLLQISDSGAKSFVLRYMLDGHERMMGLGSAADFSLKEAREGSAHNTTSTLTRPMRRTPSERLAPSPLLGAPLPRRQRRRQMTVSRETSTADGDGEHGSGVRQERRLRHPHSIVKTPCSAGTLGVSPLRHAWHFPGGRAGYLLCLESPVVPMVTICA